MSYLCTQSIKRKEYLVTDYLILISRALINCYVFYLRHLVSLEKIDLIQLKRLRNVNSVCTNKCHPFGFSPLFLS